MGKQARMGGPNGDFIRRKGNNVQPIYNIATKQVE